MTRTEPALPSYRSLPVGVDGVRTGWGLFGEQDSVGLVNLQTAERVAAATQLARRGAVFPLDLPADYISPPFFDRGAARHTVIERRPGNGFDDVLDNVFPQASSQWDSLGHVSAVHDAFYNGASADQIRRGERNTIEHWARRGIVGRGILLDVGEAVAERGPAGSSIPITVDDLERARENAGVAYRPGDVILIRTGYLSWYGEQDAEVRQRASRRESLTAAGIEHSEAMAEYLWDSHASAVASDTVALEVWPPDRSGSSAFGVMHPILIGRFGLAVGELWWLDDLAADCHQDGSWEFLVVSAPMNVPGGIGSPANAIAIK
jgi:kynurenine formamidase